VGCIPEDIINYFNAVVSLDLKSGKVQYAIGVDEFDTWTRACLLSPPGRNCPVPKSGDYDFGSNANLIMASPEGGYSQVYIGAGQKNGVYWLFDPRERRIVWGTQVGPGGTNGGIQWGSAVDEDRIYVAIANNGRKEYKIATTGQTINYGSWAALDKNNGHILWQRPDPTGGLDLGSVTIANGVLYAGSLDTRGFMYALNAETGEILWSYESGGSVITGPTIVDGVLYWPYGYRRRGTGSPGNEVLAFSDGGR
jgi:polyvinyl alcohol dehydrogenase (cytochrome)